MNRVVFTVLLLVAPVALGGCYARARVHAYPAAGVVVYQPPPPPRVVITTPPPPPYPGAVWVEGHWTWNGYTYVWVDGHWIQPRAGYVWVQPRWVRRGGGWVYVQGSWRAAPRPRRSVVVVQPPSAQVGATVQVR
ncbi:MAG: hypothetical protein NZ898_07650 [Myxococcota bacterium]|nr:hypothetical protein [Myxococcota bacterium]MDW8363026.1 hypothetical protein [Myxococcales bacterium]